MHFGGKRLPEDAHYLIPKTISGASEAKRVLGHYLHGLECECLLVIHLTDQLEHLQFTCHRGDATSVIGPTNKIIADAASLGTRGLILAHNHPSGDLTVSDSDKRFTRYLAHACHTIDVEILDHLIFANGDWTSFREMGLL